MSISRCAWPKAHVEFAPLQRTHHAVRRRGLWRDLAWVDHAEIFGQAMDFRSCLRTALDAAELDRWLGPRAQTRIFRAIYRLEFRRRCRAACRCGRHSARGSRASPRRRDRSAARCSIEEFDGEAELVGRTVRIRKAQGNFFGGKISGSFDARLVPDPSYEFQGRFDRVDLAELGHAVPFLNDESVEARPPH